MMELTTTQRAIVGKQLAEQFADLRAKVASLHGVGLTLEIDPTTGRRDTEVAFSIRPGAPDAVLPRSMTFGMPDGEPVTLQTKVIRTPTFSFTVCTTDMADGGNCIAPRHSDRKGTLGGVVTDGRARYIVSASHLLTNFGALQQGEEILHPYDGDPIALLEAGGPIWPLRGGAMKADAAMAEILPADKLNGKSVRSAIRGIGAPTGTGTPAPKMPVKVHGSMMLAPAAATIQQTNETVVVDEIYTFTNVFLTEKISEFGDSGALAVEVDGKEITVVGLLFAHNNDYSMYADINDVIDVLKIKNWSWS